MPLIKLSVAIIALGTAANAFPITWVLQGVTFNDGGTASGSFAYDDVTNTYSNVNITTTAVSGSLPGATYTFTIFSPSSTHIDFVTVAPSGTTPPVGDTEFFLTFASPLVQGVASVSLTPGFESAENTCTSAGCVGGGSPLRDVTAGQVVAVQLAGNGAPFQIRYVSHLDIGDSVVNISNDGLSQPASYGIGTSGGTNLCVGVYTFDANEELQSCCSCLVTPNGLASLSAQALNATSLSGENATSLVVKLLAWRTTAGASSTAPPGTPAPPTSSSCNPATPGSLAAGMHAWGTTVHALPSGGRSTYTVTETEFSPAVLSAAEYAHITQFCEFNQINGSGTSGQCKGCASGGQ